VRSSVIFKEIQPVTTVRQYRDRASSAQATGHSSRSGLVFAAVELWRSCSVRLCVKSRRFVTSGQHRDHVRHARAVAHLLDGVLEFFGEDGANWCQGFSVDPEGRRCLLGALQSVRTTRPDELAELYLAEAAAARNEYVAKLFTPEPASLFTACMAAIAYYNELCCRNFDDMRDLILAARDLALEQCGDQAPTVPELSAA